MCCPTTASFSQLRSPSYLHFCFFFFNDTATTEIYTLSLHDALPISDTFFPPGSCPRGSPCTTPRRSDRKSTRLNSSHLGISYAVFCLKKQKSITDGEEDVASADALIARADTECHE